MSDGRLTARVPLLLALPLALAAGLATPRLLEAVRLLGRHVPRADIQADYVVAVLWALMLAGGLLLLPATRADRRALLLLWGAKCFVTLVFMLVYEGAYPVLDTYYYLADAQVPALNLETGLGQGTNNIVALVWLHGHVLASYHAIKLTFAMVGLLGVYAFYRGTVHATGREDPRVLIVLGLFPSVLFWSSILGKDPVQLLGIGLYAYGVMAWCSTRRWGYLVPLAAGVLLASMIRVWAAPILLFPLVVFAAGGVRGVGRRLVFVALVAVSTVVAVNHFADTFGLETAQDVFETTESLSRAFAEGGSAQMVSVHFTGWASMVTFAPLGAFTALFRPLPGEIPNMFGTMAGLENAALLVLVGLALLRARLASLRHPLVLWALVLVVLWAGVYGFISYQNLGTASRFKLQVLPVLVAVLAHLARGPGARLVPPGGRGSRVPATAPAGG